MTNWYEFKLLLEHATGISMDALHVFIGVVLHMLMGALLHTPLTKWSPWFAVLGVTLLNEASDLWFEQWPELGMQYGEGLKDIILTMALPSALMITARLWPTLWTDKLRQTPGTLVKNPED